MTPEEELLTLPIVVSIHDRQLRLYGGSEGIRDQGLLESAVHAPSNVLYYEQGDIFEVAAAYAFHVAENQPFIDGNKRTGIGAALRYLAGQGMIVPGRETDLQAAMFALAARPPELTRQGLAAHLRAWAVPLFGR
jgi:death-on-curing protein